jgi:hypothetical protein
VGWQAPATHNGMTRMSMAKQLIEIFDTIGKQADTR